MDLYIGNVTSVSECEQYNRGINYFKLISMATSLTWLQISMCFQGCMAKERENDLRVKWP
jgi:hypothetical protein